MFRALRPDPPMLLGLARPPSYDSAQLLLRRSNDRPIRRNRMLFTGAVRYQSR